MFFSVICPGILLLYAAHGEYIIQGTSCDWVLSKRYKVGPVTRLQGKVIPSLIGVRTLAIHVFLAIYTTMEPKYILKITTFGIRKMIKTPNLQGIMEHSREKISGNRALTPFITGFWGGPPWCFSTFSYVEVIIPLVLRWPHQPSTWMSICHQRRQPVTGWFMKLWGMEGSNKNRMEINYTVTKVVDLMIL